MASNFNVHHNVNELMKLLEIEDNVEEGITADVLTDHLLKSVEQKSKTRGSAPTFFRKLESQSDGEFKQKYDELKVQNVIELDPLIHVLARISDDKQIRFLLHHQNKKMEHEHDKAHETPVISAKPLIKDNSVPRSASASSLNLGAVNSSLNVDGNVCENTSTPFELSNDVKDAGKYKIREKHSHTKKRDTSGKRTSVKMSDWKFLSLDYQSIDWSRELPFKPLRDLSITEQENALIENLLYILIGIEGKYMRLHALKEKPNKLHIVIDNSGDELLYTLALRITALCPFYSQTIHFIDDIDNGLVNQALAAAMREQIKDYLMLIAQLETQHRRGDLTLQKMWYLLQSCFTNMEILKHIAHNVKKGNASGGGTLSILHEKTIALTGNTKAQEFCRNITQKASVPYFEILERWIYYGEIFDPYNEFLVEDRDKDIDDEKVIDLNDDLYWETRYIIIRTRIPVFLERHSDMILKTGKYLSVIRRCGRKITRPLSECLVYTTEERVYIELIEASYKFASKELLHLLMDESDLIGRLKSIKHYFLMDQGDFIVQFMDLAGEELEKEIDDIAPNRLDSLLELSLRTSMMNLDPYKDDVRIELLPDSLLTQMSGIINIGSDLSMNDCIFNDSQSGILKGYEALALKFDVPWLLSLILNRRSITCYQMLFRHLFYCKYVERQLEDVWKDNKIAKGFTLNAVTGYAQAFALRQKMLNFVQNLEYYIMVEVIEPNYHQFLELVNTKVKSVDDMITHHGDYIEKCLRDGMLTAGDLLQSVVKLLRLCVVYSEFMKGNHRHAAQYELLDSSEPMMKALNYNDDPQINVEDAEALKISFEDHVSCMHKEFNSTLHQLLQAIALQSHENYTMLPVLYRLDFNGFYSNAIESKK